MEKETGSLAIQTVNEQTKGKENLGKVSNYLQWKTRVLSDKKMENRKERTKDSVGKYCKVDTVQRHKADSRKLQGTGGEFLRLSLPGLLHRSGDKGCSGSLSSARSANRRRFPVPWMFFLFEEKAATEESGQCWQVAPP
ncbi:hypothetical protein D623_10019201 [Myotis brandtii]|uniref:Uncharacterized protein n=1 Tax=Myotis brandtii TaxID=109478 RepID=S7PTW0_MYOBR|nr:hypothetical protein D623_10019201 [Myotis brandtii]